MKLISILILVASVLFLVLPSTLSFSISGAKNHYNNNNNNKNNNRYNNNDEPFHPAKPDPFKTYKTMYILDTNDFTLINSTLINIYNAYHDPRLLNRLEILLVVFGKGVEVYMNSNPQFQPMLKELDQLGCVFALCNNTINAYHIDMDTLFPGVNPVPSGNGEIILRLDQGWTSVHP